MNQMTICLIIFVLTLASYIIGKLPMSLTSLTCMFLLVATGCLEPSAALANFSNATAIIMVSMFVVGAALNRTQLVKKVSSLVYKISGGSFTKGMVGYCLITFLVAQFVPSAILIFGICYPLVMDFCKKIDVNPSKAMFSIGIVAIGTVGATPIGSGATSYITNNGYLHAYNITGYEFNMFTALYAKIPVLIVVVLYAIFVAPRFAPDRQPSEAFQAQTRNLAEKPPLDPVREILGYLIFLGVVVGLLLQPYLPGVQSWQICMGAAILVVLTGILNEGEAIASMNMSVAFLYIGALSLGQALVATGAGDLVGGSIAGMLGERPNGYLIGAVFFTVPFLMTQVMVNHSVYNSFIPITLLTCSALGCNPIGPMNLILTGALTAFMTPMATPTVPLMMGVAGYNQKDMFKMSWLPAIIIGTVAVFWAMTVYPAY